MPAFVPFKIQKTYRCDGCGECCQNLFGKRFGAAITPQEKQTLEILAARRGVSVNFAPLTKDAFGVVTLYQFTDNKCPFFDKSAERSNRHYCKIYQWRPMLCRAYPLMPYGVGTCTALIHDVNVCKINYTPEQIQEGTVYLKTVGESIKGATWLFDLQTNKWRLNIK